MPGFRALVVRVLASCLLASAPTFAQDTTGVRGPLPFALHGFLQIYYRSGDATTRDGYRLRKVDLKFSGDLSPRLRWRIAFDAAKALNLTKTTADVADTTVVTDVAVDQRGKMLQDAALTLTITPTMKLDVGQQIVPLSLEGTISTSQVETVERTMFIVERSRATGLGDVREVGASLNGTAANVLEYHVGLFNETGEAQNSTDPNDQKAVIGRIALHPPGWTHIQIGGSGGFEGGPPAQRRERAGGEAQFRTEKLTLRTELMTARDGALRRVGYYGLAAVRPRRDVQFVARYDSWDRDRSGERSLSDSHALQITGGASYLIDGGVGKIALNIVRQTYPDQHLRESTFALIAFQGVW